MPWHEKKYSGTPQAAAKPPTELSKGNVQVANKMQEMFANKFKRADKAFLNINQDRDGGIGRAELQRWFQGYGCPPEVADFFFDKMDKDGDGTVNLDEFDRVIAPMIHGGELKLTEVPKTQPRAPAKKFAFGGATMAEAPAELTKPPPETTVPDPAAEKAAKLAAFRRGSQVKPGGELSEKNKQVKDNMQRMFANRFKRADKAFLNINQERDGGIDREEMQRYFFGFGAPAEVADFFFDQMDKDGDGTVNLEEFDRVVGPMVHGGELRLR
jgi:Ca2+-binding EF-hand superfamily protein